MELFFGTLEEIAGFKDHLGDQVDEDEDASSSGENDVLAL